MTLDLEGLDIILKVLGNEREKKTDKLDLNFLKKYIKGLYPI